MEKDFAQGGLDGVLKCTSKCVILYVVKVWEVERIRLPFLFVYSAPFMGAFLL